jgi:dTDP-4-amino-4,6-dideoxygalactose transaminase
MYLPGEITCALARTQLGRLHEVTARARANGARFSARLADVPGLEPPAIPDDRTHVFHKYRLRFDAARAGFEGREAALRDDLVPRLRSAGVEVALWQTVPLPHHPLFGIAEPYPRTARALASTLVVGSQSYPLFAQPEEVIDTWADAFTKVWMRILQRG